MAYQDIMLPAEGDQPFQQLLRGRTTAGHVGVVDPHHLHPRQIALLQGIKVGIPAGSLRNIIIYRHRLHHLRHGAVGGISHVGHQHPVAGVEIGHGEVEDPLLGTHQRHHVRTGVEGHSVMLPIPLRISLTQRRQSFVRLVAMHVGLRGDPHETAHHPLRRKQIGVADAQVDHRRARGRHAAYLLQLAGEIVLARPL